MFFGNIWKSRNYAKFDTCVVKVSDIIANTREQVQQLYNASKLQLLRGSTPMAAIQFFSLTALERMFSSSCTMEKTNETMGESKYGWG